MTRQSGDKQKDAPNHTAPPPKGTSQHDDKPPKAIEEKHPETEANPSQKVRDKEWSRADKIAVWSVLVSAILAIVTFMLFMLTRDSNKAAIKSANAAVSADSLSKVYNDSLLKLQHIASIKADSTEVEKFQRDTAAFDLQKKSIGRQIDALIETQKDFNITNEPYLQIVNSKLDTFVTGKPFQISCGIANLGNYPVKIDYSKTAFAVRVANPIGDPRVTGSSTTSIVNAYVVKTEPQGYIVQSDGNLTQDRFNGVIYGPYYIWLVGKIGYHNIINNEKKTYDFAIKFKPNMVGQFVTNDNSPINK